MKSWPTRDGVFSPPFENVGYDAGPCLLAGHLAYLDCPEFQPTDPLPESSELVLADGVARWLADGKEEAVLKLDNKRFFRPGDQKDHRRKLLALFEVLFSVLLITFLSAFVVRLIINVSLPSHGTVAKVRISNFWFWLAVLLVLSVIAPLFAGFLSRCLIPEFDGAILSSEWKDALWAELA